MHITHLIGAFFWDPHREAFTVPILDRPIFWYGILFVTGFVLAYFILNPILSRYLDQIRSLSQLDIKDWTNLLKGVNTSPFPIISEWRKSAPSELRKLMIENPTSLTPKLKEQIIAEINRLFTSSTLTRVEVEQALPGALYTTKETAYHLADRMCWFAVAGTVIGARLGEVFFYSWPYFREHPMEIFMIWKGGLASHGGVLGVMLALYLYTLTIQRYIPQLTFIRLIDYVSVPTALTACFIRLGNFMNQEIVGTPTSLPWGIIFGHPAEPVSSVPRHPAQLYEAAAYLLTFVILLAMWKKNPVKKNPGALAGTMFILIFSSRLIIEFWKTNQESPLVAPSGFQIGQLLSIPFIFLGLFLYYIGRDSKLTNSNKPSSDG